VLEPEEICLCARDGASQGIAFSLKLGFGYHRTLPVPWDYFAAVAARFSLSAVAHPFAAGVPVPVS
jgi:hypothetical protein